MTLIGLHSLQRICDETTFFLAQTTYHEKPSLMLYENICFQTSLSACAIRTAQTVLTHLGITWMHISTYIFCCKEYGLKHIYPCSDHFESCRGKTSHMAYADHICAD